MNVYLFMLALQSFAEDFSEKRLHATITGLACKRRHGGLAQTFCIRDNLAGHCEVKISFQENGTLTGAIKRDVMTIWRVTMELMKCILLLGLQEIKHKFHWTNQSENS